MGEDQFKRTRKKKKEKVLLYSQNPKAVFVTR
jgi:hypothetical protein